MSERRIGARELLLVAGVIGASACGVDREPETYTPLARLSPLEMSDPAGWALFDRSVASGYTPTSEPLVVTLDHGEQIAVVKVRGPAPFRITVRGRDGSSLGFKPIDLSTVQPGWYAFASSSPVSTDRVELGFDPTGPSASVPELELWTASEPTPANPDLSAATVPNGFVAFASDADATELSPSDCMDVRVAIGRDPALLHRAYLTYETRGVFRSFSISRSVNGREAYGGGWLGGDPSNRTMVDEIDPATLQLGDNTVHLCLPQQAASPATLSSVRILGELDRGSSFVSRVEIGPELRDGGALVDGNSNTTVALLPGEPLVVSFERLVAPDVIDLGTVQGGSGQVDCLDRAQQPTRLGSQRMGTALVFDGGASACAAIRVVFDEALQSPELRVAGSGAAERVDWPRLVVTTPREHFGSVAWVGGFTARPPLMTGAVRIDLDGAPVESKVGNFGKLIERTTDPTGAWTLGVHGRYPDGSNETRNLVLDQDSRRALSDLQGQLGGRVSEPRFGLPGDVVVTHATTAKPSQVHLGTQVGLDIPAGAVTHATDISARHLDEGGVPALDPGMINVTAPKGHAYEFLPHGQLFAKPVDVMLPYDPSLVPNGMAATEVHTYFYDPVARHWTRLDRIAIDVGTHVTHSATNHFTIMVNAVLSVPTNAGPLSFDPTSMSSLATATPVAGMDLIEPPDATPSGDARLSLPIRIPAGRGAYTPATSIAYSSASENGWLGVGWDVAASHISIDTRWGVPSYQPTEEPRYLLDGEPLVVTLDTDGPSCSSGPTRRYHPRVEGAFAHIIRCGSDASNYYFEVRDRQGTEFTFGSDSPGNSGNTSFESTKSIPGMCSGACPPAIYQWNLNKVVDVHGNTTIYSYQVDAVPGAEPGRDVYLQSIAYTSHPSLPAAYSVEFSLDDGSRPDAIVSGRGGFKLVTRSLLRAIKVKFGSSIIRQYVLTYGHGQFEKTTLSSIREYGTAGCAAGANAFVLPTCGATAMLDEHTFDYINEPTGFRAPALWTMTGDPDPDNSAIGKGMDQSVFGSLALAAQTSSGSVSGSVGLNGSWGTRAESVGLYDMNGDGLPDQVFSSNGTLTVLYNQGQGSGAGGAFTTTADTATGIGLGFETHNGWGVDAEAGIKTGGFGASASGGYSNTTSRAGKLLTDLDGDGFVDYVDTSDSGHYKLGGPCPTGQCFTDTPFGSLATLDPGADPLLGEYNTEIQQRALLGDPVVQWTPPYTGTVTLSGSVSLVRTGTIDGVTVTLYNEDNQIGTPVHLVNTTPAPISLVVPVTAGHPLYLRVATGADLGSSGGQLHDEVSATLTATYTAASITPTAAAHVPTGNGVFAFPMKELRVNAQPIVVPVDGLMKLHGTITKQVTAADIRVCAQVFPASATSVDWACNAATSPATIVNGPWNWADTTTASQLVATPAFTVHAGDRIVVRAESDYSFDPSNVSFSNIAPAASNPLLYYTSVCDPDSSGSTCTSTIDAGVIASFPLDLTSFGMRVVPSTPPLPLGAIPMPIIVQYTPTLYVQPFNHPLSGHPTVTIAMRSDRAGTIQVITCSTAQCNQSPSQLFSPYHPTVGESISFEVLGHPMTLPAAVSTIALRDDAGHPYTARLIFRDSVATPEPPGPFVGGYRGWRTTFWNEQFPFAPTELLEHYADPSSLDDTERLEMARSAVPPVGSYTGTPLTVAGPAWLAEGSDAFITASGRMNAADLGAGSFGGGSLIPEGSLFDPHYTRLSGSRSYYVGAGISGADHLTSTIVDSASASVGKSDTNTTTDLIDVNGDGIADVCAGNRTFAGTLAATPGPQLHGFQFGDGFRRRTGFDYSIGLNDEASLPVVNASGRRLTQESKPATGGSLGFHYAKGMGIGRSQETDDLIDINGDGLPDLVQRRGTTINVRYNLGTGFGAMEALAPIDPTLAAAPIDAFQTYENTTVPIGGVLDSTSNALSHETTLTQDVTVTLDVLLFKLTKITHTTSSRTTRQFADLNGDGLPDLLLKQSGQPIKVAFNRGRDFGPMQTWDTPSWGTELAPHFDSQFDPILATGSQTVTGPDVLAGTSSQSSRTNTGGITIPIGNVVSVHVSFGETNALDTYELALVDVDGDGVPDHVLRRGASDSAHMLVKRNLLDGKSNLLQTVHRPLGGTIALTYGDAGNVVDLPHRRHVLTGVSVDDGMDLGAAFDSPAVATTYSYTGGYYDRNEKQFLGFASITTIRPDGGTIESQYAGNHSFVLSQHLTRETRRDHLHNLLSDRVTTYDVRDVKDASGSSVADLSCTLTLPALLQRVGADACSPRFPAIVAETVTRAEGGGAIKTRVVSDTNIDRFGNVVESTDTVDDAISTDDTYSVVSYSNDTTHWILGRPTSMVERAGSATGTILRSRTGTPDPATGDLTSISVATGSTTATTTLGYDTYGNLDHITTPPNSTGGVQTYDLTFDPVTQRLPATIRNGFNDVSSADYDLRFDVATTQTDVNLQQIHTTLDAFGRISTVSGPYDIASPGLTIQYYPQEVKPRAVTVTHASAPSDYTAALPPSTTTVVIADGLGRTVELRKSGVVHGVASMITSGLVKRDTSGRVVSTYYPFFTPGASTAFITPTSTGATTTTYDTLDRPASTGYPDGSSETVTHDIASAPSGELLFHARQVDANGNVRETFTDDADRERVMIEHPTPATSAVTRYDYLPTGELSTIVDAENNTTTLGYDLRGLRTSMSSGDTGLIEQQFDAMGNRTALIEPNHRALGSQVTYLYVRDRLTQIQYPSKPSVTFTYDHARLASVGDETGTEAYEYGAMGERRHTLRTVESPAHGAVKFSTRFTSDSLGRQLQIVYPDGATVTNSYDGGGMLLAVAGSGAGWSQVYADQLQYDEFGNRTHMRSGNHVDTTWAYDPARIRLASITTLLPTATKIQDLHYTYDFGGNPKHLQNLLTTLTPTSQNQPGGSDITFTYDGVDQLLHTVGTAQLDSTRTTTYDATSSFSASHNLAAKSRIHQITDGVTPVSPPETNFSSPYSYAPARPHLPTQVGSLVLEYDATGNPISRMDATHHSKQYLTWDDDDRAVDIESGTVSQTNAYDASGLRVVRSGSDGHETIFSSHYFDVDDATHGIKHIFAGDTRVASVLDNFASSATPGTSATAGTAYYFHEGNVGSTSVVTAQDGTVTESLEYFSDGETWIDRAPTTPVNGYLFNGKPFDRDTGFYDYGQRFYDPRTSLWLGLDPNLTDSPSRSIGHPMVLSTSAYAANSPARFVDPDGRGFVHWVRNITADIIDGAAVVVGGIAGGTTGGMFGTAAAGPVGGVYGTYAGAVGGAGLLGGAVSPVTDWIRGDTPTIGSVLRATARSATFEMGGQVVGVVAGNILREAPVSALLQRYLGGSGGRWGSPATRLLNHRIATQLERDGYEVIGGAGRAAEEHIPGPGGGAKGGTWVDITARKGKNVIRVQTVDMDGIATTAREAAAAARIRAAFPNDVLILVPKGITNLPPLK